MASVKETGSFPVQSSENTPSTTTAHMDFAEKSSASLPASIRALKDRSEKHRRTVVICLDGTGDRFDNDNSNVVHFVSCLKKHTPDQQVTYYQSGIGTYDKGGLKNGIGAAMDMAVGSGLGIHIKDAYRFLMQNYREGDRICLLGFSRGAYTVRCLAGMLHKVGLLPASNGAQVNFAYDFYKDDSPEGWKMSAEFKKTFCTNIDVYFVGVWDCVASVGFIPRKLPFSKSPTNSIHYFRHAMALDEHRSKFKVCQWEQQDPDAKNKNTVDNTMGARMYRGLRHTATLGFSRHRKTAEARNGAKVRSNDDEKAQAGKNLVNGNPQYPPETLKDGKNILRRSDTSFEQERLEAYFEAYEDSHRRRKRINTDALEVWFMGAHADIGGGAVANDVRHRLSHIPLRWMIRQCFECNTGILFDTANLVELGLDTRTLYPSYHPPSPAFCGPPPSLLEKYEKNKVPPLRLRRAIVAIGDDATEATDPFLDASMSDLRHLMLLTEAVESQFDALSPINDQLQQAKGWWILEFWPVKMRVLAKNGVDWEKKVRLNMGRHRAVRETEPKMHWTVRHMMDEGKYAVKGRANQNTTWQVVS